MGKLILSIGEPGTGKSRAVKNLDPKTTVIIKPNNKDLPFQGAAKIYNTEQKNVVICKEFVELGETLLAINKGSKVKTVIIEDITHFFGHRLMKEAKNKGYEKWTDLALDCFNSFLKIETDFRDDLYVIIIGHTERTTDAMGNSVVTMQTAGKMLEINIKIPSYFTYVLHTDVMEANGKMEYRFLTNSDGIRLAKSPEGCFDKFIPNDYKLVIEGIEKYQKGE